MHARSGFAVLNLLTRDTFRQAWSSGICWIMLAMTALCVLVCLFIRAAGAAWTWWMTCRWRQTASRDISCLRLLRLLWLRPWSRFWRVQDHSTRPPQTAAGASRSVWFDLGTNPDLARREGIETLHGRVTLAFGAVVVPLARDRTEAVLFLELVLGEGLAGYPGTAAGPGVDGRFRASVPRSRHGVGSARQAHCALATARGQIRRWRPGLSELSGGTLRGCDLAGPWGCGRTFGTRPYWWSIPAAVAPICGLL